MKRLFTGRRWRVVMVAAGLVILAGAGLVAVRWRSAPMLPTAEVTRGDFVDIVELRGEIRPVRSVVLTAPTQAGELRVVKLAKNNSMVKPGDVVVEFDATMLSRTRQEKLSELRQADAEIDQATAEARILDEQDRTALMRATYDVDRAALDVIERDVTVRLDQPEPRLRPGTSVGAVIAGTEVKDALTVPRQALFEKNGKPVIYVRAGEQFTPREVKVTHRTESRVALEGIAEGTEVALVNPDKAGPGTSAGATASGGPVGGGPR